MRTAIPFALLAATLACSLFAMPANAALRDRVFVASYGVDAPNTTCSFTQPCRTFQYALGFVEVGGEVTAIDSAGFGPITIIQAVTITSPDGVEAGIVPVLGGNAITINAGSSDAIVLRGLTLNGSGVGLSGIEFNSGASLRVENSAIQQFSGTGINFVPNVVSSLFVSNTSVINNGNDGISVFPTSAGVRVDAALNHVEANNNGRNGIGMNASRGANSINATVSDSVAAGNVGVGFNATSGGSGYVGFSLFHCVTSGNGTGMEADGGLAILVLAQTLVGAGNTAVWQIAHSGTINSFGDNYSYFGNAGGVTPASKF